METRMTGRFRRCAGGYGSAKAKITTVAESAEEAVAVKRAEEAVAEAVKRAAEVVKMADEALAEVRRAEEALAEVKLADEEALTAVKWEEEAPAVKRAKRGRGASAVSGKSVVVATAVDVAGERAAGEAKSIYLFWLHSVGPYAHSLCAVNIPKNFPNPDPPPEGPSVLGPEAGPEPLSPILRFSHGKFPVNMCCVALESKLYFMGGDLRDEKGRHQGEYPTDVRVFDPAVYIAGNPEHRMGKCLGAVASMKTGKGMPYGFVVDRKIYVIDQTNTPGLARFEVFDPDSGESGEWTQLKDSPPVGPVLGHAVIKRKLFVFYISNVAFSFNLDLVSHGWCKVNINFGEFWGEAVFVEDTFYSIYSGSAVAFGPLLEEGEEEDQKPKVFGYRNRSALHLDVINSRTFPRLVNPRASLAHMGNRRFCHVYYGHRQYPIPRVYQTDNTDPKRCYVMLTMFDAMKATDPCPGESHSTSFKAISLDTMSFLISTLGTHNDITGSFVLPSIQT